MTHTAKWIKARPGEPVTEVAARSLKARLRPVQRYLPRAALDFEESIEHVHEVRVAARRAEAALATYRELLPEWRAAWLIEQLKHIRQATNEARDDDVFARRLAREKDNPAAARLHERVCRHRQEVQADVVEIYERLFAKNRFRRRVAKLLKRVRLRGKKRKKQQEPCFEDWAREHLASILDEFFSWGERDLHDVESLHQFRIAGKKLRYAAELLSGAFSSGLRKNVYPMLTTLQEKLGEINDHAAAQTRIRHWLDGDDDPEEREYLEALLQREIRRQQNACEKLLAWWSPARQKKFRRACEQVLDGNRLVNTA